MNSETCSLHEGPGKRGNIVADTSLPMMFLGLRKMGNICCGHKFFWTNQKHFLCPEHKIRVHNKWCARGQSGKHWFGNNVSPFARALRFMQPFCKRWMGSIIYYLYTFFSFLCQNESKNKALSALLSGCQESNKLTLSNENVLPSRLDQLFFYR